MRVYFDSKLMLENATKDDPWSKKFTAKNDAGQGPYVLEKWEVGNEMILKRFDRFWGWRPPCDKIIIKTVPDLSSRLLLLKRGDIDVALNIPLRELQSIKKDPNLQVISAPTTRQQFIGMHPSKAPFDNKNLRLAISYAFPYEKIIPAIYQGAAQAYYGPIPVPLNGSLKESRYGADLKKAKDYLKKAGYPDGLELTLKWETGWDQHKHIGTLFQENLREIGVDLKLQQLPRGQFKTGLREKSLDFFISESGAWVTTPEYTMLLNFSSESHVNFLGYKNERVDELLINAMKETDPVERAKMNAEVQEILLEDAIWIYTVQPNFQLAMRSDVIGYVHQNTTLNHFWLVDKK